MARVHDYCPNTHSISRAMNHWMQTRGLRRTKPEEEAAVRRRRHGEVPGVSFVVVGPGPSDRDAGWHSAQELWSVSRIECRQEAKGLNAI